MSKTLSQLRPNSLLPMNLFMDKSVPLLQKIDVLEKYLLSQPQVDAPIREFYGDGVYMRELFAPAGTLAVGKIHKFDHLSIMISGELFMWTQDDDLVHLKGYNPVRAKAGVKRLGYIIKDMTWVTFHKVGDGIKPEGVEDYLTAVSWEEYLAFKNETIKAVIESGGRDSTNPMRELPSLGL